MDTFDIQQRNEDSQTAAGGKGLTIGQVRGDKQCKQYSPEAAIENIAYELTINFTSSVLNRFDS